LAFSIGTFPVAFFSRLFECPTSRQNKPKEPSKTEEKASDTTTEQKSGSADEVMVDISGPGDSKPCMSLV
jgi:hypothetical protein